MHNKIDNHLLRHVAGRRVFVLKQSSHTTKIKYINISKEWYMYIYIYKYRVYKRMCVNTVMLICTTMTKYVFICQALEMPSFSPLCFY